MKIAVLKMLLETYGIQPKKSFGQHFLIQETTLSRIATLAKGDIPNNILEIGPGPGTLSRALLSLNPTKLVMIEKDARFKSLLEETLPTATCVIQDALTLDWSAYGASCLIGNLPYNVSVPILLAYISVHHLYPKAIFMFQKEVAKRIVAKACNKAYGRLSVMVQAYTTVSFEFDVPPSAFWPMPAVDSSVLSFSSSPRLPLASFACLERIVKSAFQTRRKMIRQSLKGVGLEESDLVKCGLDPCLRAEDLSVDDFCALVRYQEAGYQHHLTKI